MSSVFYVKKLNDSDTELVLKIFKKDNQKNFLSELAIMSLLDQKLKCGAVGFPQIVSSMQSEEQSEILMTALGPSLKKLLK